MNAGLKSGFGAKAVSAASGSYSRVFRDIGGNTPTMTLFNLGGGKQALFLFTKVGKIVTVTGRLSATVTTGGGASVQVGISVPFEIASIASAGAFGSGSLGSGASKDACNVSSQNSFELSLSTSATSSGSQSLDVTAVYEAKQ